MSKHYVLDACALIALLAHEPGYEIVEEVIRNSSAGSIAVHMNKINLLEVYYKLLRIYGKQAADDMLTTIKQSSIKINARIHNALFLEAARVKVLYSMSLADSIAIAEASVSGGTLLTADHHEMDIVEQKEPINFQWIR